ncbi:hypothetical protein Tco_0987683 [Tanacetum coccineum]
MTTARTRAVVNTGKGKLDIDLKKSRWVWRPKENYLDHVSKDSGSFMLKKGNPEILLQDHAVVDSGFSSHITGNKAYLSDYEDFNGGFIAFGSDPKGDELKFNLFSVSQMCDKKNSVLFTESECLILSPSFKTLDESQVVPRAPRKDDVYSLDLKNIVPSKGVAEDQGEASAYQHVPFHILLIKIPSTILSIQFHSTTEPPHSSPPRSIDRLNTEVPQPQGPTITFIADEATTTSVGVETEGAATTTSELMAIVPKMVTKIDSLEKELKEIKQTLGHAILTLVQKVKSLEVALKRINSMEEKEADFVTPKKVSTSGEAQEEDISPTILEAAQIVSLARFLRSVLYLQGEQSAGVNTGNTPVSTPSVIQTVNVIVPSLIRQEEAGLAEAMRLQALQDEEDARQVHLDALLAKRIQEEQELSEQQQKRKAKVQEASQFYTEEDWDTIRAKLEANAEHKAEEDMESLVKGNDTVSYSVLIFQGDDLEAARIGKLSLGS